MTQPQCMGNIGVNITTYLLKGNTNHGTLSHKRSHPSQADKTLFFLPISSTFKPSLMKMAKTRSVQKRDTVTPVKSKTTDSLKNTTSSFGGSLGQRLDELDRRIEEFEKEQSRLKTKLDELEAGLQSLERSFRNLTRPEYTRTMVRSLDCTSYS